MLYGLVLCDGVGCTDGTPGPSRAAAIGTFDNPAETAGDALAAMTAAGWAILQDGSTLCPGCAVRSAEVLPAGEALRRLVAIVKAAR